MKQSFNQIYHVKLWKIVYAKLRDHVRDLENLLSKEEADRSKNFIHQNVRENYIIRHAALRWGVANTLGIKKEKIFFSLNPFGKPSMPNQLGLEFNMSSSNEIALIAFSWIGEVGVDIECFSRKQFQEPFLLDFFPWMKQCEVGSPLDRSVEFCTLWTKYEALAKSEGFGIGQTKSGRNLLPKIFDNTKTFDDIPNHRYSLGFSKPVPLELRLKFEEFSINLLRQDSRDV